MWSWLLLVCGVVSYIGGVDYVPQGKYPTVDEIQQRLVHELRKRDPHYVRCASILAQPISEPDGGQVAFFGEEKLQQQLAIVKSLAQKGLYLPKEVFKRAAQGAPEDIVPRWKYHVALPAAYHQHMDLCYHHPRIGRLPAQERWDIIRQAISWPARSWYCLLQTYIFDRIRKDTTRFTQLGRDVYSCRDACQVCNAIYSLAHMASRVPQSRHRLACVIRRMTMTGDIEPHRYKHFMSPHMIAYRGDTAEQMMEREQHDIDIDSERTQRYHDLDACGRDVLFALHAYADNDMSPARIVHTCNRIRDYVGDVSSFEKDGEFVTQLIAGYRDRTSRQAVADLLYHTAGMARWHCLVRASLNACPEAMITPVYKNITPLHYVAINDHGDDLLPHAYLHLCAYDACPPLYNDTSHGQTGRQPSRTRTNPCSLYDAAADVKNVGAMRDIYQLYGICDSGLAYLPREVVHEIYTYTAE